MLCSISSFSQWHDAIWMYGQNDPVDPRYGTFYLDFNEMDPQLHVLNRDMNLDVTVATMCDSTGNLLFYTNGIYLANFNHEMLENGDSLNPGELTWQYSQNGLFTFQSLIALPFPEHENQFYLLHLKLDYDTKFGLAVNTFYATLIDMSKNDGYGKVIEKNIELLTNQTLGTITAVKHSNGRDWWLVISDFLGYYYKVFEVTPDGLSLLSEQDFMGIPPEVFGINGAIVFSSDGTKMAQFEVPLDQVVFYDFDRCTVVISDPNVVQLPETTLGGGQAFSSNGRFFYIASSVFILQLDLWASDIEASLDTVAIYDGFVDPSTSGLATRFFAMQNGPDGRIYINTTNATKYLHYIQYPNKKGDSCQVVQHGIELPFFNIFTSPHFPNYRLGPLDGSPCDTLGLDNHPLAGFRHAVDSSNSLRVIFTDNSFYQPTDWLWDLGDGSTSSLKDPLHKYDSPGTYLVCLTVSNQYDSDTFCREVTVDAPNATNESITQAPAVKVWPNPARSGVVVELPQPSPRPVRLFLYDALGREVYRMRSRAGDRQLFFDVSGWAGGVYFGQVEGYGFFKVVVE